MGSERHRLEPQRLGESAQGAKQGRYVAGWDQDAMQANVAAPGPRVTDQLIDWVGGYNVYYVCPGAYGEGTITREQSPHLRTWMEQVINADGAYDSGTSGTSGFREYGLVFPKDVKNNSHPIHPDHPGHFVCY